MLLWASPEKFQRCCLFTLPKAVTLMLSDNDGPCEKRSDMEIFVLAREKGKRARGEKEKVAPAAGPLFISSRPFINMQTANIHDPSIKMLFTFCGNLKRANEGIADRKEVKRLP